jgi:hypothetical protein
MFGSGKLSAIAPFVLKLVGELTLVGDLSGLEITDELCDFISALFELLAHQDAAAYALAYEDVMLLMHDLHSHRTQNLKNSSLACFRHFCSHWRAAPSSTAPPASANGAANHHYFCTSSGQSGQSGHAHASHAAPLDVSSRAARVCLQSFSTKLMAAMLQDTPGHVAHIRACTPTRLKNSLMLWCAQACDASYEDEVRLSSVEALRDVLQVRWMLVVVVVVVAVVAAVVVVVVAASAVVAVVVVVVVLGVVLGVVGEMYASTAVLAFRKLSLRPIYWLALH